MDSTIRPALLNTLLHFHFISQVVDKNCLFEPTAANAWKDVGCFQRVGELGSVLSLLFAVFIMFQIINVILTVLQVRRIRAQGTKDQTNQRKEQIQARVKKRRGKMSFYDFDRFGVTQIFRPQNRVGYATPIRRT